MGMQYQTEQPYLHSPEAGHTLKNHEKNNCGFYIGVCIMYTTNVVSQILTVYTFFLPTVSETGPKSWKA